MINRSRILHSELPSHSPGSSLFPLAANVTPTRDLPVVRFVEKLRPDPDSQPDEAPPPVGPGGFEGVLKLAQGLGVGGRELVAGARKVSIV
jgi:hypothetical protein